MFPFDIEEFLREDEESNSGEALITDEVRGLLVDIADRLNSSLETLVTNSGPIRQWFQEIQDHILDNLSKKIAPAAFLNQYE